MSQQVKGFASRWGLIFSLMGASIGTGNIWRFPRMAALNGGGSFVLAWTIMLFAVSIPVIIAEMVMGRSTRHGCPGAFKDFIGEKYTWMGAFLALTTIGITSYYTVIMAWTARYFFLSFSGAFTGDTNALFNMVSSHDMGTVGFFIASLAITAFIVGKKISSGCEAVCKFMIPALFVLLVICAVRALTLPGAMKGVEFYVSLDKAYLLNSKTWLNALTQSAWSVGPGWGLVITYGVYTKARSDVALNEFMQGLGDNSAALLAGFVVLPALFAFAPSVDAAKEICASGNTGLTFISLANLFPQMPGGIFIGALFFIALYFAALTSNLVMFLTGVVPLVDAGISRKKATWIIFIVCLLWGLPSAWNIHFLNNQDWVFGMTLLIGTLFTCFAMIKFGTKKVREKYINITENDLNVGPWWDICIKYISPIGITIMFIWWTIQSIQWYPETWWNPFLEFSTGTFVVQGAIMAIALILLNKTIANGVKKRYIDTTNYIYPEIPEEHV